MLAASHLYSPRGCASSAGQRHCACISQHCATSRPLSRMLQATSSGSLEWDPGMGPEALEVEFLEDRLRSLSTTEQDLGDALMALGAADKVRAWGSTTISGFLYPDPDKSLVDVVLISSDGATENYEICSRLILWLTGSAPALEALLLDQFELKAGQASVMAMRTINGVAVYKNVLESKNIRFLVAKAELFEVRKKAAENSS